MKPTTFVIAMLGACSVGFTATGSDQHPTSNFLWYEQPAKLYGYNDIGKDNLKAAGNNNGDPWQSEALPIGNGRIGAMVFGGDKVERLALNEVSFWSGGLNPGGGYSYGPEAGKDAFGAYQPFGDLLIQFEGAGETSDYTRSLNLENGIASTTYTQDGVTFKREVFASFPGQVIVMTCTASKPGALNMKFNLHPNHSSTISAQGGKAQGKLSMAGTLKNDLEFEGVVMVIPQGGTISATGGSKPADVTYENNRAVIDWESLPSLKVEKANSCTVIISLATDYVMDYSKNWKGTPAKKKNNDILAKLGKVQPGALKSAHVANYKSLFDRVKLDLGKTDADRAQLPTNERIKAYRDALSEVNDGTRLYSGSADDPELESTLFQYGRYMLISGSRPGSLPATLQGIWNDKVSPPWACDYHNNINVQMCYWGAEPANLSECHQPLIDYIEAMQEPCRIASQKDFKTQSGGKVRGWTVRTSQNIFGGNGWQWNIPGNAWYGRHIWDHFAFSMDQAYLKNQGYPMMKEISEFWEDHLKSLGKGGEGFASDDKDANLDELKDLPAGTLVAPHGWSPEHGPREDGVSHDQQLIWDLFSNTITASDYLRESKGFSSDLLKKRDLLAKPKIGKEGNLQEWMIDRQGAPNHRHTSHLYAVYPGNQISMEKTPELAKAAKKALEDRGSTGDSRRSWTWPWRTALWARFKEGNRAHDMIAGLIHHNLLDNMLATHPPMQMDGTYGITGAMCEMLLQSHTGDFTKQPEISLLPAPTEDWPSGKVKGLKARGNITVDFQWEDGKVTKYRLTAPTKTQVKLTVNGETKTVTTSQPKDPSKKNKKQGANKPA
jgi:alpha-L-fucosidase 2